MASRWRFFCTFVLGGFAALTVLAQSRQPWTTSRVQGSPEPPKPFVLTNAFPKLKFREPIEITAFPGSDRLVLAEHGGRIVSFPDKPDVAETDLFADMKAFNPAIQEVYSVAFHPKFAENHYAYIWYILASDLPEGTHVSRFKVRETNPPTVDLQSEFPLITWLSGGHNGGCLRFAKDGTLFISTGDAAPPDPPDFRNTGQDISDLLSSILRIDVDHPSAGRNYSIPSDNPFIKTPNARPEMYAYGLRNPWRMSVDSLTGDLWVADVGWELWEMVYRVQKGANYGWSIMEGSKQVIKAEGKRGPTPIIPPTFEHPHSEAASITGGYVYRGKQFKDLYGTYVYGDYATGKIFDLIHNGQKVVKSGELAEAHFQVVSFGEDRNGELLVIDYGGTIHRFARNPNAKSPAQFPRKLSETGLFTDTRKQQRAVGVYPFSLQATRWVDGAQGDRFLALPGTSAVDLNDGHWIFPSNSVLAKTLSLPEATKSGITPKRVETQLLHYDGQAWQAYSYRWNKDQTDADLVPSEGAQAEIQYASADGIRQVNWRYHSRAECLRCHNPWCDTRLGFVPALLAHTNGFPELLRSANLVTPKIAQQFETALAPKPADDLAPIGNRARAWLHANCSHCHREHAGGAVLSFMNYDLPLGKANLIGGKPMAGTFGLDDAQVIAAGDPERSVLLYRAAKLGKGHMPYLGASESDSDALKLLYQWIKQLPQTNQPADVLIRANAKRADREQRWQKLKSNEATREQLVDSFLQSAGDALFLRFALEETGLTAPVRKQILARATQAANPLARDLFEQFLPYDKRSKTMGADVNAERILKLTGNAVRGRNLFFSEAKAQCTSCHALEGQGREFGPDLSAIAKKYSRSQLLEQIVYPSRVIDAKYLNYSLETGDDESYSGFIIRRDASEVVLKDAAGVEHKVPAKSVKSLTTSRLSVMPEGLLQNLTEQEAADLIAYLATKK